MAKPLLFPLFGFPGKIGAPLAAKVPIPPDATPLAAPVSVTLDVGALSVTGFAPTVSTPIALTIDTGVFVASGNAPSVVLPVAATLGAGSVIAAGLAPTVSLPVSLAPPTAALSLVAFAPTLATPISVSPGTGALALTAFAPSLAVPVSITIATGSATLAGLTPSVATPTNVSLSVGQLALTGFAPSIATPVSISFDVGAVSAAGFAPTVALPVSVALAAGDAQIDGLAPSVAVPVAITIGTGALTCTSLAPTVISSIAVDLTPPTATIIASGFVLEVAGDQVQTTTGAARRTKRAKTRSRPPIVLDAPVALELGTAEVRLRAYALTIDVGGAAVSRDDPLRSAALDGEVVGDGAMAVPALPAVTRPLAPAAIVLDAPSEQNTRHAPRVSHGSAPIALVLGTGEIRVVSFAPTIELAAMPHGEARARVENEQSDDGAAFELPTITLSAVAPFAPVPTALLIGCGRCEFVGHAPTITVLRGDPPPISAGDRNREHDDVLVLAMLAMDYFYGEAA